MRYFILVFLGLSILSCKKQKPQNDVDESHFSYYDNVDCLDNPDPNHFYIDSNITARMVEADTSSKLLIGLTGGGGINKLKVEVIYTKELHSLKNERKEHLFGDLILLGTYINN